MKSFSGIFIPCSILEPHHFPGPSATHSFARMLEPKSPEQGGPHCRLSALRLTPLSPLPPAPPRLQLLPGPRGLRCAGILVFYRGSLGGTISYKDQDWTQDLGNRICAALQCGTFLEHLTEAEATRPQAPGESEPLPIRWKIQNASCASLEQCFRKVQPWEGGQTLALVCSGE